MIISRDLERLREAKRIHKTEGWESQAITGVRGASIAAFGFFGATAIQMAWRALRGHDEVVPGGESS